MRKRSLARTYVLQILYQVDITREDPFCSQHSFWDNMEEQVEADIKEFAEKSKENTKRTTKVMGSVMR